MRPVEFQTRTAVARPRRAASLGMKQALEPLGPDLGSRRGPSPALIGAGAAALALAGAAYLNYRRGRAAERAHPPIGDIIEVDGVAVHYLERGAGPPLVLLHGNGALLQDFTISGLMDRLAETHRVIAVDRPGYGYTGRPRTRSWTAAAQAAFLRRVMGRLGVERPVVVGHSWGAIVAMAWALKHQDELAGLVLLSGYYYPTPRRDVLLFGLSGIPVIGDLMRYTVAPAVSRSILPKLVQKIFAPSLIPHRFAAEFPLALCLRPWQLRASAEEVNAMIPGAALAQGRYGELRLPVTIVTGDGDQVVSARRQSMRLHGAVPHSELRVLPGLGHMIHYFAGDEIAALVEDMSARVADGRARDHIPARSHAPAARAMAGAA